MNTIAAVLPALALLSNIGNGLCYSSTISNTNSLQISKLKITKIKQN